MTDPKEFYERIREQRNKNFPFVVYREPSEEKGLVRGLLQSYLDVYKTEDFKESGFVFAPFDDEKEIVFIPSQKSEVIETIFEESHRLDISPHIDYSNSRALAEKEMYISLIQGGIDAIRDEKFKKVVLSRKELLETGPQDPVELFTRLLDKYPTAFVYLFYHPLIGTWMGATPEVLLEVERNKFKTMALAGTQRKEHYNEVEWSPKEKEEQQIVTDSIVQNLKEINVKNIQQSQPYTSQAGDLLHLRTDISGTLDYTISVSKEEENEKDQSEKSVDLKKLLQAIHPTPAVCGYPKDAAKDFILKNENYEREFYTGFLGEVNMKREIKRNSNRKNQENQAYSSFVFKSSLYVNLRCMKVNDDNVELFVGGGVTAESLASSEWEETQNKTGTMKAVLDMLNRKMG